MIALQGFISLLYWIGYAIFWLMAIVVGILAISVLIAIAVIAWPIALFIR